MCRHWMGFGAFFHDLERVQRETCLPFLRTRNVIGSGGLESLWHPWRIRTLLPLRKWKDQEVEGTAQQSLLFLDDDDKLPNSLMDSGLVEVMSWLLNFVSVSNKVTKTFVVQKRRQTTSLFFFFSLFFSFVRWPIGIFKWAHPFIHSPFFCQKLRETRTQVGSSTKALHSHIHWRNETARWGAGQKKNIDRGGSAPSGRSIITDDVCVAAAGVRVLSTQGQLRSLLIFFLRTFSDIYIYWWVLPNCSFWEWNNNKWRK